MATQMVGSTRAVSTAYFDAWLARDAVAMRAVLAKDVLFEGPLGNASNADEVVAGFEKLAKVDADGPFVRNVCVEGDQSITWFEMRKAGLPSMQACNWLSIENGLVTHIHVIYDIATLNALAKGQAAALFEAAAAD